MLFLFTNIFLMSNALTNRRDKSILFSRTSFFFFIILPFSLYNNTSIILLVKGIALYSGLFFVKPYVYSFTLFLYIVTCIILVLTSFYPYIFVEEKIKTSQLCSLPEYINKPEDYNIIKNNDIEENYNKIENNKTENYYKIIFNLLEEYKIIEYALIIVFVITGASLLMCSNDIISIFLSIELQSYGLYLLCAVYRNSEQSINAGLTYFLLGGLSSCIILLGQSLLYINSGNTNLDGLYIINNVSESINFLFKDNLSSNMNIVNSYQYYIHISLVLMSVGFLFKISSAPFHFWSPFVYDAIPTKVTTFVAIVAKISILIFFYELVYYTNYTIFNITWKNNLILSSLLSLIVGSILGLTQTRIKRLYAYSTISHLGFILLTLSIRSVESTQAFFFYILQYSISNLNAFVILIAIGYSSYLLLKFYNVDKNDLEKVIINYKDSEKETAIADNVISHGHNIRFNVDEKRFNEKQNSKLKDINLSPIQLISQIKGYYEINPILAVSLGLTLFSFLGVPPLIGFFGKQMVLSAALDRGYVFMTLIAIITSVISAVYYLFIIKQLFFEENEDIYKKNNILFHVTYNNKSSNRHFYYKDMLFSSCLANVISIITLILVLFIFISKESINLVNILSLLIFYID